MGSILNKRKNEVQEVVVQNFDFLSIFDSQFSIDDFQREIENGKPGNNQILDKARKAVKNAYSEDDEKFHYEVIMSDEMKDAIESGEIQLVKGKDGLLYAQLRGEKGHFGKPLPIEKQLEKQGVTLEQLQIALQMETIINQLETMVASLKSIEGRVTQVIQGQHNDRIGLFYSGLSLYAESKDMEDKQLKKYVQAQALKALSDSNSQVIQEIRTCIEYLVNEKYKNSNDAMNEISERLSSISKCFDVVYRATFLKAAIYYENGEIPSMLTTIDEYGRFVEKLIVPYAGVLSELDQNDRFIEKGTWGTIANTLSICGELREKLSTQDIYYLNMKGDEQDNG